MEQNLLDEVLAILDLVWSDPSNYRKLLNRIYTFEWLARFQTNIIYNLHVGMHP